MRQSFLFCLILLAVSGCSTSRLEYRPNIITIENSELSHLFQGETISTSMHNLADITIQQKVFLSTLNEMLVYESARLRTAYSFKNNYQYILRHIFDARDVSLEKDKAGLGFFKITLKDNTRVFAIAKTSTKRSLSLLYGLSEENFNALLDNKELFRQDDTFNKDRPIKSRWNMKLIIEALLLERKGGRPFWK